MQLMLGLDFANNGHRGHHSRYSILYYKTTPQKVVDARSPHVSTAWRCGHGKTLSSLHNPHHLPPRCEGLMERNLGEPSNFPQRADGTGVAKKQWSNRSPWLT